MTNLNFVDLKIEKDFQDFQEILNQRVYNFPNERLKDSLKQMHKALYINKMLANELFYDSNDIITAKRDLNYHLLISCIVLSLFGDNYTSFFLLRGSLENVIKCILLDSKLNSKNRFSNNLEYFIKIAKEKVLKNVGSLAEQRKIKKSFNNFCKQGRENLYGEFSNKIHIKNNGIGSSTTHLIEFFNSKNLNIEKFDILKTDFIFTVDYESMLFLLNISELKKGKFSEEKVEYFRNYCKEDYKEILNLIMKYL